MVDAKMVQYNDRQNISRSDEILSHVLYYLNKESGIGQFLMYRRTYRNYLSVIIHSLRKKFPLQAILRSGNSVTLHNNLQVYLLAQGGRNLYDYRDDIITLWSLPYLPDKNSKVKLSGVTIDSDMFSVLVNSSYQHLPVKGYVVYDVGANIGDSCIYFALRGAGKVIGIEPFPKTYELAKKNIELNGLSNKIITLLAGCAAHSGYITIDPSRESSVTNRLEDGVKNGIKVPLLTLEDILNQNSILSDRLVLKMDCEGCEYENLLYTSKDTLQRFSHMLIEYHYGYKNIKEKLEECGFNVSVTRPGLSINDRFMRFGYILAKLK